MNPFWRSAILKGALLAKGLCSQNPLDGVPTMAGKERCKDAYKALEMSIDLTVMMVSMMFAHGQCHHTGQLLNDIKYLCINYMFINMLKNKI